MPNDVTGPQEDRYEARRGKMDEPATEREMPTLDATPRTEDELEEDES